MTKPTTPEFFTAPTAKSCHQANKISELFRPQTLPKPVRAMRGGLFNFTEPCRILKASNNSISITTEISTNGDQNKKYNRFLFNLSDNCRNRRQRAKDKQRAEVRRGRSFLFKSASNQSDKC